MVFDVAAPCPVQHVTIVDMGTVRRATIAHRIGRDEQEATVGQEALMFTGGENIIKIHLFVQCIVKDPSDFVFHVRDPEQVLHSTAKAALRGVVGSFPLDYTLREDQRKGMVPVMKKKKTKNTGRDFPWAMRYTDGKRRAAACD